VRRGRVGGERITNGVVVVCRLFGLHAGAEDVDATFWLLDAPFSISEQSHRNPDGYGLATFTAAGELNVVKRPARAAEDETFARHARATHAEIHLAHVRYADTGGVTLPNTHPFTLDGRAFAHNGVVAELDDLDRRLGSNRSLVAGDTDSERVFALITVSIREHGGDVRAGIIATTTMLAQEITLYSLNFLLATPGELWAFRYPEHNRLYLLPRAAGGPRGDQLLDEHSAYGTLRVRSAEGSRRPVVVVASEPMDEDLAWQELDSGELLHVGADLRVRREVILSDPPRKLLSLTDRAAQSQAQER
jgi:glutamine amidotransferase